MRWQSVTKPAKNGMNVKVGEEEAEGVDEALAGVEEEGGGALVGEGADSEVEVEDLAVSVMSLMASCSRATVLIRCDEVSVPQYLGSAECDWKPEADG